MTNQGMSLQTQDIEDRIAARIDTSITGSLAVSDESGGLSFANVSQVMEFAKMMSVAQIAIPKHLRGNPGACLGVCIQAVEWRMSPFAVANKSYSVNDRLAYEAQLIQAVILQRAPIKGRLKVEYSGEGGARVCRVWAELREQDGGEIVEYKSPPFDRITPKNSPLWKSDPDQQQFYYSSRALARRHFPDVILGVYAKDEFEDSRPPHVGPERAKDITPLAERLAARSATPAAGFDHAHVQREIDGAAVGDQAPREQAATDTQDSASSAPPDDAPGAAADDPPSSAAADDLAGNHDTDLLEHGIPNDAKQSGNAATGSASSAQAGAKSKKNSLRDLGEADGGEPL